MEYEDLTPEQQAKARACKTLEDVIAFAKEEGYELSDAELESVTGGVSWDCPTDCPAHHQCPQNR